MMHLLAILLLLGVCSVLSFQSLHTPVLGRGISTGPARPLRSPKHELVMVKSTKTKTPDLLAPVSYVGATATQWTLLMTALHIVQIGGKKLGQRYLPTISSYIVRAGVFFMFFFLSVRSRVFSPLNNSRPLAIEEDPVFKDRKRPSWQPPPIAFPIIWSTIAVLRALSATLIFGTKQTILAPGLFWFVLHLSIGDTWNTINNVEKRIGTAVPGVLLVLASLLKTISEYHKARPAAALVLAPSAVWITVASFLVFSIWRLNSTPDNIPSLFPSKEEGPCCVWRIPLLPR